jgi:hypothetical protein
MKRNYKYEKEMLHWLDGGEIECRWIGGEHEAVWRPLRSAFYDSPYWEYRISKPADKKRWLYVNYSQHLDHWFSRQVTEETIGKIRMEDI